MTNTPMLEVESLATGYGDLRVVWDVSLQVRSGEVFALLGRNGAGKTTTLRAIAGLNPTQHGSVKLRGESVDALQPYERVRRGLGYVQEGKRIFRELSVEDNLRLGLHTFRGNRAEIKERYERAYETFPVLASRKTRHAGLLSGGQQQMLAIAQALMPNPSVLLVDEPSAGLAPAIVGDVVTTLARLRDEGLAIVLVEQSVDFALAIAADVSVIDLGRVSYSGSTSEPGASAAIRSAYMGELLKIAQAEGNTEG
jgi:branched-chain amino acid transport system ATP-binding protein